MDKGFLRFQVYGYYKVVITISKNTNKKLTLYEQYYLCIMPYFHTWQIYGYISKIGI
jgi:hypothetical protein